MRILGLIPARGGSKGLPGKNIRPLCGKPLIGWTIAQALASRYIDKVVVSTDDKNIMAVARFFKAEVPFLRPKKLATDKARSIDVIAHAINFYKAKRMDFDYLILLEPTSPLREVRDIDRVIEMLINNKVGAVSMMSVSRVEATHPAYDVKINGKGLLVPYGNVFTKAVRRQDLEALYFFEGTIYLSEIEALLKKRAFYHERTLAYVVPRWKAFEIDELMDLYCVEAVMKRLKEIKRSQKDG